MASVIDVATFEFCGCNLETSNAESPGQVSCTRPANFPAQILMFLIKSALRRVSKDFTRLGSSANLEHSTIINWKGKFLIKSFRSG